MIGKNMMLYDSDNVAALVSGDLGRKESLDKISKDYCF